MLNNLIESNIVIPKNVNIRFYLSENTYTVLLLLKKNITQLKI